MLLEHKQTCTKLERTKLRKLFQAMMTEPAEPFSVGLMPLAVHAGSSASDRFPACLSCSRLSALSFAHFNGLLSRGC